MCPPLSGLSIASLFSIAYTASPLFVLALPPSSVLPIQPAHYLYWLYLQVQYCLYSQPTICTGTASSSVLPIQPAHYLYWLCLQVQCCLYSQPTICAGSASKFSIAYTASPLFVLALPPSSVLPIQPAHYIFVLALPPSSALPIQPAHYLYWLCLQVQCCLYSQPTICAGSASKFSIAYTASPLFVLALPPSSVLPIQPAHYLYWLCLQVQCCLYSQPTICTGTASKFSVAYTASPLLCIQ